MLNSKATMVTAQPRRAGRPTVFKRAPVDRAARIERRQRLLGYGVILLCFAAVVLLHVWLRLQVVNQGYALSATTKLQQRLEQEQRELRLEYATMTSPERVEALARRRLGLRPPEKGQVIVLP
jgi:cell division protein FtsL